MVISTTQVSGVPAGDSKQQKYLFGLAYHRQGTNTTPPPPRQHATQCYLYANKDVQFYDIQVYFL